MVICPKTVQARLFLFLFSFSREEAGIYSHMEKNIRLDLCHSVLVLEELLILSAKL